MTRRLAALAATMLSLASSTIIASSASAQSAPVRLGLLGGVNVATLRTDIDGFFEPDNRIGGVLGVQLIAPAFAVPRIPSVPKNLRVMPTSTPTYIAQPRNAGRPGRKVTFVPARYPSQRGLRRARPQRRPGRGHVVDPQDIRARGGGDVGVVRHLAGDPEQHRAA